MIINVTAQSELCSTYIDSCNGCLENSCAWVPVAGCLESCDVITDDVSCYTSEDFPERITTEEICSHDMAMEASNIKLCNSQTDCTTCLDTTFVEGVDGGTMRHTTTTNTCKWFKFDCCIESYCGHECNGMGCGALTCDAVADIDIVDEDLAIVGNSTIIEDIGVDEDIMDEEAPTFEEDISNVDDDDNDNDNDPIINNDCDSNMSCRNCLSTTRQIGPTACGWVNGMGCFESCNSNRIATGRCYDIESYNGNGVVMTGDDICTVAENDIADIDLLCSSQTDCTTCIETSLLVGSSSSTAAFAAAVTKCRWFSDRNFCGSKCINMVGCGETTCTTADGDSDSDGISEATDNEATDNESDLIMEATSRPATTPSSTKTPTDSTGTPTSAPTTSYVPSPVFQTFNPTTWLPTNTYRPSSSASYTPLSTVLKFRPPSSSSSPVDAGKSSAATKDKSNYCLVFWTATATVMVVASSCLL
ncbi:hypothetical protein FRACYDRAFT_246284 [Fragilariopsis cylindrus CCMP1102]|uniref:Uncharacterized protein n=1 Tax=Fragilariopsis cylindrus CCMP1102 TaxID=635003 RepID=A0A1E7EZ16_9STRA|nr:hypothetical protein FRACYDRAFT_246284 [Fragilariopsis cylindrus CCMP1102]|eukprot:OEU11172.1 hypothetical protein FRACYDRAFT_246284 [Fragilariopsis cylindrus CCMP1102]